MILDLYESARHSRPFSTESRYPATRFGPAHVLTTRPLDGPQVVALVTYRGERWAVPLSLVRLGGQIIDLVGAAFELGLGPASSKVAQPTALGVDPTLGVVLNLSIG